MAKRRYPGVSPFKSDQKNLFFGREQDIKRLYDLILLRDQVLLYSKSGIGKTSLLNAGVIPNFEDKLEVINVRFYAHKDEIKETPLDRIIGALQEKVIEKAANSNALDAIVSGNDDLKSLWYYFKRYQLANTGGKQFLLVFDQFEELFSYPLEEVEQFKNQLYELLKVDVPDNLIQAISEIEDESVTDALFEDLNIKTVFAIRSDRLSKLNRLTDKFPNIQEIYYELRSLNRDQARRAIVDPALEKGRFSTRTFQYTDDAVDSILDQLSQNGTEKVESAQLQIVCSRIEKMVEEIQRANLKKVIVEKEDLPKFGDIFLTFYRSAVARTDQETSVIRFIEDELIRNGQRISMDSLIISKEITEETLKILTDAHLLRREPNSTGGISYELSHDTLIEPILTARKSRVSLEEAAFLEDQKRKEFEETKIALENERIENKAERKRKRAVLWISTLIGLSFAVLSIVAFVQWNKSTAATAQAERLKKVEQNRVVEKQKSLTEEEGLNEELKVAKKDLIDALHKAASAEFDRENYDTAIELYDKILDYEPENEEALMKIHSCTESRVNKELFYKRLDEAKMYFDKNQYRKAQEVLSIVKKVNYEPGLNAFEELQQKNKSKLADLKEEVDSAIAQAEKLLNRKNPDKKYARKFLDIALQLDPNNVRAKQLMKKL